ncbi:LLM class flavin-dependent oxidoreductase [Pseudomonas aeruginosa]
MAIRPGIVSPTVSARMAATLDRLSGGRLLINVVTGGDPDEEPRRRHPSRPRRALRGHRRVPSGLAARPAGRGRWTSTASTSTWRTPRALYPPLQRPYPPLYFGGSSEAAHELAGEQVDVYLTWGEPLPAVAAKIADVRQRDGSPWSVR